MTRCVIVGASYGSDLNYMKNNINPDDYIISADAGLEKLIKIGILPNLIVGDFDSYKENLPKDIETLKFPICKDDTDMLCAVKEGIKRGCNSFVLFGGIGGRLDHTIANLCVLEYLSDRGYNNLLLDEKNRAFIMGMGERVIQGSKDEYVSVFPFGMSSCNVSYEGLKYKLDKEILYSNISSGPMGVSNSFLDDKAKIIVNDGKALVIISKD